MAMKDGMTLAKFMAESKERVEETLKKYERTTKSVLASRAAGLQ